MRELTFYFDFISPYAYIGWHRVQRIASQRGIEVVPIPVLFAALLNTHGQKGPAEIPAKRNYMWKDTYRKAHRAGLPPLVPPPSHPFKPLLALRLASLPMPKAAKRTIVDALFAATWAKGIGVDTPERVTTALAGLDVEAQDLLRDAELPESKERVRQQTDSAIQRGAFGVPTIMAGDEMFWGVDSLELLEDHLDGKDPLPGKIAFPDVPASASRLK
jgi:2-hydroxychromene-2-carboxylate isomerase